MRRLSAARSLGPCLVLLGALLAVLPSRAQEATPGLPTEKALTQFVYDEWTTADGLPHGTVHDLLQTADGYLWVATEGGLARFDGVSFTVFDKANTPAFRRNDVRALAEGPDGALWIGTWGGGVLRRSPEGRFEHFGEADGLAGRRVSGVAVGPGGAVWVAMVGGGVSRYADGRFATLGAAAGLPHETAWAVVPDSTGGGAWVGTNAGVTHLAASGDSTQAVSHRVQNRFSAVRSLARAKKTDGVWTGGNLGVHRATRAGGMRPLRTASDSAGGVADNVWALYEDARGTLWAGTGGNGLVRVPERGAVSRLAPADGLAGSGAVFALEEDREGSLWIGTDGGLARLRDGAFTTYTSAQGLPRDGARVVRETSSGRLVATTTLGEMTDARLSVLAGPGGRFVPFPPGEAARREMQTLPPMRALAEGPDGTLWGGGMCGPLTRIDPARAVRLYRGREVRGFNGCIAAIAPRAAGGLWLGMDSFGGGLFRFAEDEGFEVVRRDTLPNYVSALLETPDGTLWIGTVGEGLWRMNAAGDVRAYDEADGLAGPTVQSLHRDADGTLWIGSNGGGLTRFRDGAFAHFSARDGLFDDVIYGIVEEGAGALWMSTSKGIMRVKKAAIDAFEQGAAERIEGAAFTERHGLANGQGVQAQPAAWRGSDGRLWFATRGGPAVVDPSSLRSNEVPPPVHVERFTAGGDTLSQGGAARDTTFRLAPGTEDFAFRYAGLSYVAPGQVRFQYRLEGRDEDWQDAGPRRAAFYTDLAPGRYTFRVKAANADGVWSAEAATLSFVLEPHFYETWWFYLACALGLAALGYGGYRLRVEQLRQRQHELEDEVAERTRDLRSEKETTERLLTQVEADNQRKTQELEEARDIQLSMLPKSAPALPGLDVAVHMETATEVGGDYYDFRLLENGEKEAPTLLAAIGDATGHGMKAGLVVASAKSRFQALSGATSADLPGTVRRLSQNIKDLELRRMYMSLALLAYRDRRLRLVGAGLPPALHYRADEGTVEEVPLKGAPLGSFPEYPYREHGLALAPGDALLFMSDGLMELRGAGEGGDPDLLGQAPIEDAFREAAPDGAEAVVERLRALARQHAGARPPDDDITLLVLAARA